MIVADDDLPDTAGTFASQWGLKRIHKAVWRLRLALARGVFAAAHLVDPAARWDRAGDRVIREAERQREQHYGVRSRR